jgi:hypothetical protein
MALVLAIGVREDGYREVLGWEIGHTEEEAFWTEFLRKLVRRGLRGVRIVTSDAHEGLKKAISRVLTGTAWQRCRVHFMRNILARAPKSAQQEVSAAVRTVFAQPDLAAAREQLRRVAARLAGYPKAAALLIEAGDEILAHMAFPEAHRRRIHSTNPLERLNAELKRRSKVVGIFPNPIRWNGSWGRCSWSRTGTGRLPIDATSSWTRRPTWFLNSGRRRLPQPSRKLRGTTVALLHHLTRRDPFLDAVYVAVHHRATTIRPANSVFGATQNRAVVRPQTKP